MCKQYTTVIREKKTVKKNGLNSEYPFYLYSNYNKICGNFVNNLNLNITRLNFLTLITSIFHNIYCKTQ